MPEKKIIEVHVINSPKVNRQDLENFARIKVDDKNVALCSCTINGEPATAICVVEKVKNGGNIIPLFVSLTPGMTLVDIDGERAMTESEHSGADYALSKTVET
jgi:hypothetical protein